MVALLLSERWQPKERPQSRAPLADIQKQPVAAGKINMVGDRELYNTAVELTRIMGYKNAAAFFNDPAAINLQTGLLLHPPPTPPPDPKLLAVQARAQVDAAISAHQAQLQQQKAQNDAIHLQVKTQGDIELAKIKAALDAKTTLLEAHLKAAVEAGKTQRAYPPGARKARDGHHYVPDPQRPGKHLLVVHHV